MITQRRKVELSDEQAKLWKDLKKANYALLKGSHVTIVHEAAMRNKLLQVAGVPFTPTTARSASTPASVCRSCLRCSTRPMRRLWCSCPTGIKNLAQVEKAIKASGNSVVTITGDTNINKRSGMIANFQKFLHPRVIVADPRTMAHGVELDRASIVMWWLPVDSNELYQQAIGEID